MFQNLPQKYKRCLDTGTLQALVAFYEFTGPGMGPIWMELKTHFVQTSFERIPGFIDRNPAGQAYIL